MVATTERRRNAYADACRVCGVNVPAEQGYLYSDTHNRSSRRNGGWRKFVKCERCHSNALSHAWQVKNLENPTETVRRWSVTDVSKWDLEVEAKREQFMGAYRGDGLGYEMVDGTIVHVHVTVNGDRVRLAGGDVVLNRQQGPWYMLEWNGIGGKPFTPAAWKKLQERVHAAIDAA